MNQNLGALIQGFATIIGALITAFVASGLFSNYFVSEKTNELPSWEMLYSHNESGVEVEGSLENLKNAVLGGYEIKIIFNNADNQNTVIPVELVAIDKDIVSAQSVSTISWWEAEIKNGERVFPESPYHPYMIFDTNGNYRVARFGLDGQNKGVTHDKRSLIWLGNIPKETK